MIYGKSFFDFFRSKELGKFNFDINTSKYLYEFTIDEFHKIVDLDIVFNGLEGGLILGNLHSQGGIHLIQPNLQIGVFRYVGEMEGWEYLTPPFKTTEIQQKFEHINSLEKGGFSHEKTEFDIPPTCKVVDTLNKPMALLLLTEYSQFIVNRFATKKYINELIVIDNENAL
jgi:hypothetical protein